MADLIPPSKWSQAANPDAYLRDVTNSTLRQMQTRGMAPETLGVTVPLQYPKSAKELGEMQRDWRSIMRQRKGPAGYDSTDTPHESSYVQRRYDFISGEEAIRKLAYDDATGRPVTAGPAKGKVTVGIGFNMDAPGARDDWKKALGLGDKEFDETRAGKRVLSTLEIRKLFDYTVREAEDFVDSRFKGVDLAEHQRLSLVSLAFNSPSLLGPRITEAIKSKNWKGAIREILFNSNRKADDGLAKRRYREAAMFNGPASDFKLPDLESYIGALTGGRDKMSELNDSFMGNTQVAALRDHVRGDIPAPREGDERPKDPPPITGRRA